MHKRVEKELKLLHKRGYSVHFDPKEGTSLLSTQKCRFDIPSQYPFKMPRMLVKMPRSDTWVDYHSMLCIMHRTFVPKSTYCICCNSLSCVDNWAATHSMIDLILEYEDVIKWAQTKLCLRWINRKLEQCNLGDIDIGPWLSKDPI